jgi:hypothetical protein
MLLPAGQSGSLLLLLVVGPILAVTHRLNKLLPFIEVLPHRMLWVATFFAAASMPMFGFAGHVEGKTEEVIKAAFATQGLAILTLFACPFVSMIMKNCVGGVVVAKAVRNQVLIITYLAAALIMAMHVPIYHILEKRWVAADTLFKVSPDYTSITQHETLVTKQMLSELDLLINQIKAEKTTE